MSETPIEQTDQPQAGEKQDEAKTFDSEYVDKLRKEAARYRTEAKANADAAKRLAEIEESQKSESEKVADRIKQLESAVSTAQQSALRFKVASEFGIATERAELLLTGSDEETMRRQAEALKGESDERKRKGNHVPREGTNTHQPGTDNEREFVRNLFGRAQAE